MLPYIAVLTGSGGCRLIVAASWVPRAVGVADGEWVRSLMTAPAAPNPITLVTAGGATDVEVGGAGICGKVGGAGA